MGAGFNSTAYSYDHHATDYYKMAISNYDFIVFMFILLGLSFFFFLLRLRSEGIHLRQQK